MLRHFSRVQLFATLWTIALQALQSMGFSTRVLEWVAIPFSRVSSPPKDRTVGLLHYRQILYR